MPSDDCRTCPPWKKLDVPDPGKWPGEKKPCPETLAEMCKEVNEQFYEWKKWGIGVNRTLNQFAEYIWRLEHAVCCLESYVIHGEERPKNGLICKKDGEWRSGTFHDAVLNPWPVTPPPDEPWE